MLFLESIILFLASWICNTNQAEYMLRAFTALIED